MEADPNKRRAFLLNLECINTLNEGLLLQHVARGCPKPKWSKYPAINKPASVLHWLNHANVDAEFIVILDVDMIIRGPITPWEFKAARGRPVSTPYEC